MKFDSLHTTEANSWEKYIEWSKLDHLTEVISLDMLLCKLAFEPDYNSPITWDYLVTDGNIITDFFTSFDYILNQLKDSTNYNLLAITKEPVTPCEKIEIPNFTFLGYDLIDKDYSISALTNCGGFNENFLPTDLNKVGLIDTFEKAISIREKLLIKNLNEFHADCFIFALWKYTNIK